MHLLLPCHESTPSAARPCLHACPASSSFKLINRHWASPTPLAHPPRLLAASSSKAWTEPRRTTLLQAGGKLGQSSWQLSSWRLRAWSRTKPPNGSSLSWAFPPSRSSSATSLMHFLTRATIKLLRSGDEAHPPHVVIAFLPNMIFSRNNASLLG
jgi:hypothetical protein